MDGWIASAVINIYGQVWPSEQRGERWRNRCETNVSFLASSPGKIPTLPPSRSPHICFRDQLSRAFDVKTCGVAVVRPSKQEHNEAWAALLAVWTRKEGTCPPWMRDRLLSLPISSATCFHLYIS